METGAEKIFTKSGERYAALIEASRLKYHHQFERERIQPLLLDDAKRSITDIVAGRTIDGEAATDQL